MIRNLLKPLSFVPALLLMYMIFSFSSQTGDVSSQLSYQVSCKIIEAADFIFDAGLNEWQIAEWANKINFITRKLAHMTEYFALAVAVSFPLYVYGLHGILLMLAAGLICVGFACGDEYHQAFVAGRSPSVKDVGIDSVGVFFGIIFVRIIGWTGRHTIFRPKEKTHRKAKYEDDEYYDKGYRYQSEGWLDEEDIDISSPRDESYDAGWQDPSRANDWGMDEQPQERQAQERPGGAASRGRRPMREPEPQPHKKKKVKKEKDWFFDM